MISRTHRFHGYGSLKFVYKNGQTVRGPVMSIKYTQNPKRKSYRAAVVVSRKVHKSAVARNRMRRRIYETIRSFEDKMSAPYDIVVTVFNEQLAELTPKELSKMIHSQLSQAGIVHKNSRVKISSD
jgi:ribonuclease P protein component